jgi:hypothetical protein
MAPDRRGRAASGDRLGTRRYWARGDGTRQAKDLAKSYEPTPREREAGLARRR